MPLSLNWKPEEAAVAIRRASLSDLSCLDDIELLSVRQLKEILARNFVNFTGCCEKWELMERVRRLYQEQQRLRGKNNHVIMWRNSTKERIIGSEAVSKPGILMFKSALMKLLYPTLSNCCFSAANAADMPGEFLFQGSQTWIFGVEWSEHLLQPYDLISHFRIFQ